MSFTIETASPPLTASGGIQLYAYEPFKYRFVYPAGDTSNTYPFSNTSPNLLGYLTADTSGVTFAGSSGYNSVASSAGELLVIVDSASKVYSNRVFAGSGRFTTSLTNSNIVVHANEPFTPIQFIPSVPVDPNTASTQPTLPANFRFVGLNSNTFQLQGYPAATTANSNYIFVASNASNQIVSANLNIQVLPERVQLFGGPASLTLTVGTPITPVKFTATAPLNTSSNLNYTLPSGTTFPSGLYFMDAYSNRVTSTFYPTDPSGTVILAGTPTADSPTLIGNGSNSLTSIISVRATSVYSGVISNSTTITASYTETVIFTQPSNGHTFSNLTVGLAIPTNNVFLFNAKSLFGMSSLVNYIYSPDLRSDLSLNSASGSAYLTGTPSFAGTGTYTAIAVSSGGVQGYVNFSVVSSNDIVTLTPFVDTSLNFVIGRPLSNALPGRYSSNLTLTGSSSAGQPLSFATTGFATGGITVNTTSNSVSFSGVPTALVSPTTASVTVYDGLSNAIQTVGFSVSDDEFTWGELAPVFEQNRPISPIQLSVTTLSGRVVLSYTVTGLPSGLSCTRSGYIQGTCTGTESGNFIVTASTGISTQTKSYSYTVVDDSVLVSAPAGAYILIPGQAITPIQLTAYSYSGRTVQSFALAPPAYGLTVTPTGLLGGTLYSGVPPQNLYSNVPIVINTQNGLSSFSTTYTLASTTVMKTGQFAVGGNQIYVLYTDPSGSLLTSTIVGPVVTGDARVSPYSASTTATASDAQVNSAGRMVASASGLNATGSTVFGSVFYGPITQPAPSKTFLTATGIGFGGFPCTIYRSAFSVAYSGSGSTWYALGQGYNKSTVDGFSSSHVYLLKSDDDGQTWTLGYSTVSGTRNWALEVQPQYVATNPFSALWAPSDNFFIATLDSNGFSTGAVVLKNSVAAGVYMAGGGAINGYSAIRITSMTTPSTDTEATIVPTWTPIYSLFGTETREFALDGSPWVAAGSSLYNVYLPSGVFYPASTLRWSADEGLTWSTSIINDFTFAGVSVAYGSGRWLALGNDRVLVSSQYVPGPFYLKSSINGKSWTDVTIPATPVLTATSTVAYANSQWIVNVDGRTFFANSSTLPVGGWTTLVIPNGGISKLSPIFSAMNPYAGNSTLITTNRDPTIQLTSPSSLSYAVMQYTFMTPTTLVLNQSPSYFFAASSTLPPGIQFDSLTGVFSGMALATGSYVVRIVAKSSGTNYNEFDFTFNVFSPYPVRRQDTASAYTAYVRQEAIIAGAQFSRDSNALPSENTTVGAAMGPMPPEVESAPPPCCK